MAKRKETIERLATFSDGVFAVIITIMVLESTRYRLCMAQLINRRRQCSHMVRRSNYGAGSVRSIK
jgi:hypothetical protein